MRTLVWSWSATMKQVSKTALELPGRPFAFEQASARLLNRLRVGLLHLVGRNNQQPTDIDQLAGFLPVRHIRDAPLFAFAIYSVGDGSDEADLEGSCHQRGDAETLLNARKGLAAADTTLFLVNWPKRQVL